MGEAAVQIKVSQRNKKEKKSFLEGYFLGNPSWKEGWKAFHPLYGRPEGWLFITEEGARGWFPLKKGSGISTPSEVQLKNSVLELVGEELSHYEDPTPITGPIEIKNQSSGTGIAFPLSVFNQNKGFVVLMGVNKRFKELRPINHAFFEFIKSELELSHKNYELNNFYETIHPRALALSTMHSLHRVISASLRLDELLPRIGRLSAQVLKARECRLYLVDLAGKYLIPKFSMGTRGGRPLRIKKPMGRGIEGRVAHTGEIYLNNRWISCPFIDEDVVGVITLGRKVDRKPFTYMDLEILKSLAEQAVIAIKNAQLYEETQQLTVGSIKSINELLELDYAGENIHQPLFRQLVREMAMRIGLQREELTHMERAVLLLDTGYIGTPQTIRAKRTRLTKKEFEEIKKHPLRGVSILKSIASLKPLIPIILHHHERWDGKGYPHGLKGEEIPMGARVVCVADSFTAMISSRPYRKPKKISEAIEEIKNSSGTQFDPRVVDCFLKVVHDLNMT